MSQLETTIPARPDITIFMLVKTQPEWLGFSVDERFDQLARYLQPVLRKHQPDVQMRFFDVEFYSTRVTDLWLWEARSHRAWQLVVEDLRETPLWDRYFQIVDILPGVEDAYAENYGRDAVTA
jgi:hypothetical protein